MGLDQSKVDRFIPHGARHADGRPWLSRGESGASPYLAALLAQIVAVLLTGMLARSTIASFGIAIPLMVAAFLQGMLAAALGHVLGLRIWWLPIQFLFAPALIWTLSLHIPPGWFLGALALLSLVYWSVARTRVPLYLSSGEANRALVDLLPPNSGFRMLDLGAGLGGVLAKLSAQRPDGHFLGIELAPLPFAAGWLRSRLTGQRYLLRWGDFWSQNLAPYDVVYAYLSPVPMPELWRKAMAEMRAGSLLVCNTFPVPGVAYNETVQLADFHRSRLYLYRIPKRP